MKSLRILKNILSILGIFITAIAFVLVTYGLYTLLDMERSISNGIKEVETKITDLGDETSFCPIKSSIDEPDSTGGIGEIIFPRKDYYKIAIFEDTTKKSLSRGAGRLLSSARLNDTGNCVVFGHRDSSFRNFPDIKEGDIVIAKTPLSTVRYVVNSIFICSPSDDRIMEEDKYKEKRRLTMVTCYPFTFVGPAPQRFVVIAYEQ